LADVYRYVLSIQQVQTVPIHQELNALKAYIFLLNIRFQNQLIIEIQEPDYGSTQNKNIVPLELQMLLENAVKHNEVSKKNPLHIKIQFFENKVRVENSLQVRFQTESNGLGHKNLVERHALLRVAAPTFGQSNSIYWAELPLL
jgi:LytS/YehU family sensor histidine kinase